MDRERTVTGDTLPYDIPIFPLPGALLLPGGQLPLNIFEPRYLNMIEDALSRGRFIGMIQPLSEKEQGWLPDGTVLYDVGCLGRIVQFSETGDGRYIIQLQGVIRFRIDKELDMRDGYRRVRPDYGDYLDDFDVEQLNATGDIEDRSGLLSVMNRYFDANGIEADTDAIEDAPDGILVTSLAMSCPFDPGEKQALLESPDTRERGKLLRSMFEFSIHAREGASSELPQ